MRDEYVYRISAVALDVALLQLVGILKILVKY